ncbi:hypothetical protein [Jeotgalibacillus proteolyticus]
MCLWLLDRFTSLQADAGTALSKFLDSFLSLWFDKRKEKKFISQE